MLEIVKGYLKKREVKYKESADLSRLSTVRIGGEAKILAEPQTIEELSDLLAFLKNNKIKCKILGRMSNVIPSDKPYDGVVVRTLGVKGLRLDGKVITVSTGEMLPSLALRLAELGIDGLTPLSGIPGTVGGSIVGNAGAFGTEIAELVKSVTVYDGLEGGIITLPGTDLGFSYRSSILKNGRFTVLSAELSLGYGERDALIEQIKKYKELRLDKQPTEPCAGSVFKRSADYAASMLIDRCGLKGRRVGGAMISKKHAGFIINTGGAFQSDYIRLAAIAEKEVLLRFGVRLEREVEYL